MLLNRLNYSNCRMFLVLLVLCLLRIGYSKISPSSVLVPSNAITAVTFSCSATQLVSWRLNGTVLTIETIPTGVSVKNSGGVPILNVDKESVLTYNGTSIQCRQAGENFSSVPTAFIIVYGHNHALLAITCYGFLLM